MENFRSRSMRELRFASRMAFTLWKGGVSRVGGKGKRGKGVHFFCVADVGDKIAGRLDDFIADFVVGFEEHFDLSVVVFLADLALRTLREVHSY